MQGLLKNALAAFAMLAATGAGSAAYAFDPQPGPSKALLLCEAQDDGRITLIAFDHPPNPIFELRDAIGESCLGALSMVMRSGDKFDVFDFDGVDTSKFGIIIIGGKE